MIQEWVRFTRGPEACKRVVFLSDYDMLMTERLVQGVDFRINTPRRPWEACGTGGMKMLVNGGLNLPELDGWWAEAYTPEVGWAIGDGKEHDSDRNSLTSTEQYSINRMLRFGEATISKNGDQHMFEVQVYLNGLDPDAVRVELYAEGVNGGDPVRKKMTRGPKLVGAENSYLYGAQVQATRPATDFTARVIPHRTGIAVPLEAAHILWQR